MRKMFRLASWTFMALLVVATAEIANAATETNWQLSLQFKLDGVNDLAPVVVGVGTSDRLLRPPSLPGTDVTGDVKDVWLRAYVADPVSKVAAFKAVADAGLEPGKNVWALKVAVPASGKQVSVAVDTSNYYTGKPGWLPILLVDPKDHTVTKITGTQTLNLFTTDSSDRTLYLVVSPTKSFAAASSGQVVVLVDTPGASARVTDATVKLLTSAGCADTGKTPSSGANGLYTIDNVADGSYVVKFDKPYYIGADCALTASSTEDKAAACGNLYAGDVNTDDKNKIDVWDLAAYKPYFGKSKSQIDAGVWASKNLARLDLTGDVDPKIDIWDLSIIKNGYGKTESFICGS